MNDTSTTKKSIVSSRLGKRFAIFIVLFSSCFTLLSTSLQLVLDYRADISRIEQQFVNIKASYLNTITLSVWSFDDSQLKTQMLGLSQLPDIEYVAIKVGDKTTWEEGVARSNASRVVEFPLIYHSGGLPDKVIGKLLVTASIDNVYKRLINKAGVILVSNAIKTFLVSGFILLLVWLLIARHLNTISKYIASLDFDNLTAPLVLDKKEIVGKPDEIDSVSHTINYMRKSLHNVYQQQQALLEERNSLLQKERQYKENLEEKVAERTEQLENSMASLRTAQTRLIDTEKMAALGNLVAGVAHEINTPIGVCRTAASVQEESQKLIKKHLDENSLTQAELENFLKDIDESSRLFSSNIIKASELISNFKLIATDQSHAEKYTFNLHSYLTASIQTIYFQMKDKAIDCQLNIPKDINLDSYPGAFHQILSNLIHNSILHGFENNQKGIISITASTDKDQLIIIYTDNGRGLSDAEQNKLFEPFFTTKRGRGGSGLGMTIVFNVISQLLQGEIDIINTGKAGFQVRITTPLNIDDATQSTEYIGDNGSGIKDQSDLSEKLFSPEKEPKKP